DRSSPLHRDEPELAAVAFEPSVARTGPMLQHEGRSISENETALLCLQRHERRHIGYGLADGDAFIQMQLARAAIIVKAIGEIDILLDLDQRQAGANRMNRAGRRIEDIAGFHRLPEQLVLNRSVERRLAKLLTRHHLAHAKADNRVRFGGEDHPSLILSAPIAGRMRGSIVGMNLHRELLAGEEIFDQQFRIVAARILEPDLADGISIFRHIAKAGPQFLATPGFLDALDFELNGGHAITPRWSIPPKR